MRNLLLLAALLAPVPVSAPADTATVPAKTPFERLGAVDGAILDIDKQLELDSLTQAQLLEIKERLGPLEDELGAIVGELEPYIEGIDARLEQLGKTPAPNEDPNVTADRAQELKKRQEWDDALKRSKILQLRCRELIADTAKHRRDMFSAEISARTSTILGPTYWRAVAGNSSIDAGRLRLRFGEGIAALSSAMSDGARTHLLFISLLGLVIAVAGTWLALRLGQKLAARWLPDNHLRRTLVGLWTVIACIAFPVLGASLVADALEATNALTPLMATVVGTFVIAVRIVALIIGLTRAWLQPRCPQWRLVWWNDAQVARLRGFPSAIAILVACRLFVERINDSIGTSLHVSILGRTIFGLAILSVFAVVLSRLGVIRHELVTNPPRRRAGEKPHNPIPAAILSAFAWVCVLVAPVALVLGYNAFAIFIVRELTQVAIVLAALLLLMRLADDVFDALLSEHFPLGRLLRRSIGFSSGYVDQVAVVLAAAARVALVYAAARLILLRLGGEDVTSVAGRIQDGLAELKVGEVTISPGAIVGALLVFMGVWFLTRTVRRWLENSYLPHTQLDSGARNSLSTGIGYFGFMVAVLMSVAYLGVSLEKVALIASALSVGIGFGLQAIISNFVSGLILLVERPNKVGDQVSESGTTGDVRKISVRATEIAVGDGSTVVVPNSDLISKPLINKTRFGARGLVQIMLRVVYGADPSEVRKLVLEVIAGNDKVLREPAPNVLIDDVDDRGYVFNITANVGNPRDVYGVRSELFFAITQKLRSAGIALANPLASEPSGSTKAGTQA